MAEAERPKETGEAGGASASDDAPPQAGAGVNVGLESMLTKRALPSLPNPQNALTGIGASVCGCPPARAVGLTHR